MPVLRRIANNPALLAGVVLALANAVGVDVGDPEQLRATITESVAILAAMTAVRQTVYGPKTADDIMDGHEVIAAAERGEHG